MEETFIYHWIDYLSNIPRVFYSKYKNKKQKKEDLLNEKNAKTKE